MSETHGTEHEHEHEHKHEHNHRESFAVECGEAFLEAHMHDQAATVSMAICPDEGKSMSFQVLVNALCDIAAGVEAMGGIVGHIKAFARDGDVFAHASVTEAGRIASKEGDADSSFGPEADVQLVAIALLVGQDELIALCKKALS